MIAVIFITPFILSSMVYGSDDSIMRYIGSSSNDLHGTPVNPSTDKVTRFYRRLPASLGDWDGRLSLAAARWQDSPNRLESLGEWMNQLENQRQNSVTLFGHKGLNNWKREGGEAYKNMFLGVRG